MRLGRTHINKLTRLGELLGQYSIKPAGFALVGVSPTSEYGYYTERPVRMPEEPQARPTALSASRLAMASLRGLPAGVLRGASGPLWRGAPDLPACGLVRGSGRCSRS